MQRVSPLGVIIEADRGVVPREVISPGVGRNAFASFHVAVTAMPNTLYYLAAQSYPPGIVQLRLSKEGFLRSGRDWIPDTLAELRDPKFSVQVMPDYRAPDPAKTTEVYLLDIWVPPETPPGIVRVEALAKTAFWQVAPMELRILPVRLPNLPFSFRSSLKFDIEVPADRIAETALLGGIFGLSPASLPAPATVRAVLLRNAAQDAAVCASLIESRRFSVWSRLLSAAAERWASGAEAYLQVRNYLLRLASI